MPRLIANNNVMNRCSSHKSVRVSVSSYDAVAAALILALDRPDFPYHALQAINRIVSYEGAAVFVYRLDELVYLALDELLPLVSDQFATSYPRTFRFSPFFQHHRRGLASGIYQMHALAAAPNIAKPECNLDIDLDSTEETGYRTKGWPKRIAELDIAIALTPDTTAQVALYRIGTTAFDQTELSTLKGITGTLHASFSKFWQRQQLRYLNGETAVSRAIQALGSGALTSREYEVLQGIINGLECKRISEILKISEETVKTHRKKAYTKLGIRTKAELFHEISRIIIDSRIGADFPTPDA